MDIHLDSLSYEEGLQWFNGVNSMYGLKEDYLNDAFEHRIDRYIKHFFKKLEEKFKRYPYNWELKLVKIWKTIDATRKDKSVWSALNLISLGILEFSFAFSTPNQDVFGQIFRPLKKQTWLGWYLNGVSDWFWAIFSLKRPKCFLI